MIKTHATIEIFPMCTSMFLVESLLKVLIQTLQREKTHSTRFTLSSSLYLDFEGTVGLSYKKCSKILNSECRFFQRKIIKLSISMSDDAFVTSLEMKYLPHFVQVEVTLWTVGKINIFSYMLKF